MAALVERPSKVPRESELNMAPAENDHDLLIRIDTRIQMMRDEMRESEKASQADRARLWTEKASAQDVAALATRVDKAAAAETAIDHERRIRRLEWALGIAFGASTMLQLLIKYGLPH